MACISAVGVSGESVKNESSAAAAPINGAASASSDKGMASIGSASAAWKGVKAKQPLNSVDVAYGKAWRWRMAKRK